MKKLLSIILLLGSLSAAVAIGAPRMGGVNDPQFTTIEWSKPKTDSEWAEDTKKEQLHFKTDEQLSQMKASHERKLVEVIGPLYEKATQFPDVVRWEVIQSGLTGAELEAEVQSVISSAIWEYEKMQQSVMRINKEIDLRARKKVNRSSTLNP